MQKKTNSYVEAVKLATQKQLQEESLRLDFNSVNNWSRFMINNTAKMQGKQLREIWVSRIWPTTQRSVICGILIPTHHQPTLKDTTMKKPPKKHYWPSASRGDVQIKDLETDHIQNIACMLTKRIKEYKEFSGEQKLLPLMINGSNATIFLDQARKELARRTKEELKRATQLINSLQ